MKSLKFLFDNLVTAKNPVFEISTGHIEILRHPVDFYLAMLKGVRTAYRRVILSSLYIGDGPLERFLMEKLQERVVTYPNLRVSMLIDFHRSRRGSLIPPAALLKALQAK